MGTRAGFLLRIGVVLAFCVLPSFTDAATGATALYRSPNGKLIALVETGGNTGEAFIEIRTSAGGRLLFRKSYACRHEEGGSVAAEVAWSADSRYLFTP